MKAAAIVVDGVKVPRREYPSRERHAMIIVASALGWHSFNVPKDGREFPVKGIDPVHGRPDDLRSRSHVPEFSTLDDAWDVLNWFTVREGQPIALAFRLLLGEDWMDFAHDRRGVRRQIMDAAYSAILAGRKAGWV